ncbi:methyltransferase-like protein 22 isoform X2 [Diabrotica undecimpunctata]|uniref:methyltransferase-like protein 22 isoform X2 n=1 Tax=Diabrotica undecimpunctata TaxID=50387 RepID=UPI003B636A45
MDDEVSSEIYKENNYFTRKKPTFDDKNVVSKFNFVLPQRWPGLMSVDADGDLNVLRKNSASPTESIEIEHKQSTIIDMVGLQIWRGALLLADWLIYNHEKIPTDSVILELGSGVGLTSIVASMYFPVICTAVYDDTITEAFVRTIHRLVTSSPSPSGKRSVYIALEKRFVFTLSDCDTVAPCYEYYLKCLDKLTGVKCEEVSLAFPKSFEYDRVKELVLWKVTSV